MHNSKGSCLKQKSWHEFSSTGMPEDSSPEPEPSCSNRTKKTDVCKDLLIENRSVEPLEFLVENENDEIERLQLPNEVVSEKKKPAEEDERVAKIDFRCYICGMREMVHYFGKTPAFVKGLQFRESTYVLRDPFQPPPPYRKPKAEYFVAIGSHCCCCHKTVCKDNECSFFYVNTYCLPCARQQLSNFPVEIQKKLHKQ
uniref:Cysteine-rich DPF motif domain-containing protein 1 n=1 Tax=Glossina austeni TaxID=7395 RepID=A0A1A9VLW3_GLOAU